jgi:tetratricopeptide (TPR) repeat protein
LLRAALKVDPALAAAAYNLAVIVAKNEPDEAVRLCGRAARLRPDEGKYAYTLAFFQRQKGDAAGAVVTLRGLVKRQPDYGDAWLFLGDICESQQNWKDAEAVYREALKNGKLPMDAQRALRTKLMSLTTGR